MTVIADDRSVHDIAGIMGGEHSGCSEDDHRRAARNRLFRPPNGSRGPGSASWRSPRMRAAGSSAGSIRPSSTRVWTFLTDLILEICGGEASAIVRAGQPPLERRRKVVPMIPPVAAAGRRRCARAEQKRDPGIAGLRCCGRLDRDRPDLAPRCRRRGRHRRGSRAHPRARQHRKRPLPRAEGVARPTATPAQKLERRCAARRRRAG
jgi:phenylalanyl-tRNA synthetase beta chain